MDEGRIVGLDVGEARTGVALSDPLGIIATAHSVIQHTSPRGDAESVRNIVQENDAVLIVAGLPLNREGEIGPQARSVLEFLEMLKEVVEVDVVTQDERYSTAAAHRSLDATKVRGKKRKKLIDQVAAQHILQLYLDRRSNERNRAP